MSDLLADFIDVAQFAADVRKHPRTVHRWMTQRSGLPFSKVGNRRLIHVPSARAWIMSRMRQPSTHRKRTKS
jgi:hypothetical protein